MSPFDGFTESKARLTPIPAQFFTELLTEIDHLGELKVTLYAFWRISRMEGRFRFLQREDFLADECFMQGLGENERIAGAALDDALERAAGRGVLLRAVMAGSQFEGDKFVGEDDKRTYYFLNTPKGRTAIEAIRSGKWRPSATHQVSIRLDQERPNVYRLYEEHIGPLTPMIAETLREAEAEYPPDWLEDAVRIAVEKNARNWRYVAAILRSWKEKGRDEQDRRNTEKDGRRYIEDEFADFIEH